MYILVANCILALDITLIYSIMQLALNFSMFFFGAGELLVGVGRGEKDNIFILVSQ